jgi:hypothetical protein
MCELCDNRDKWFENNKFGEYDSGIFTKDNIIRLYNQGGYDCTEFKCKFCPLCGKKLDEFEQ